ncbi:hypothetical protein [Bradyrhizobium sp. URHD0069]|uniref:hypothetical protein n=1 Tax=Bradyrhizobium sp. URHD0069 TaxID=1380355 RepID=UPI0012DEF845|nr:hypothetical protein [Bradyrhizobium sp. URHD0069]
MTKPGQDVNGIARTDADHHMKCPACGQWFDMRDLAQVVEHIHDGEIEVLEGPAPRREGQNQRQAVKPVESQLKTGICERKNRLAQPLRR